MRRRTTIEIDDELLSRAKAALGSSTTRETVEAALRQAADQADAELTRLAASQAAYLDRLPSIAELDVLGSDEMWR